MLNSLSGHREHESAPAPRLPPAAAEVQSQNGTRQRNNEKLDDGAKKKKKKKKKKRTMKKRRHKTLRKGVIEPGPRGAHGGVALHPQDRARERARARRVVALGAVRKVDLASMRVGRDQRRGIARRKVRHEKLRRLAVGERLRACKRAAGEERQQGSAGHPTEWWARRWRGKKKKKKN
jgi:hypothetical protein